MSSCIVRPNGATVFQTLKVIVNDVQNTQCHMLFTVIREEVGAGRPGGGTSTLCYNSY